MKCQKTVRPKSTKLTLSANSESLASSCITKTTATDSTNEHKNLQKDTIINSLEKSKESNLERSIEPIREEEKIPDDSVISDRSDQESIRNEEKDDREELKIQKLYQKFETDPLFTHSTREFIDKLYIYFQIKSNSAIECTSFVNSLHNLFTQHIGKVINKRKYSDIDDEIRDEYFLYVLNLIVKNSFFSFKPYTNCRNIV